MKVRATRLGYYGRRRQKPGTVFILKSPSHFSVKWMEAVDKAEVPDPETVASDEKLRQAKAAHAATLAELAPVVPKVYEPEAPKVETKSYGRGKKASSNKDVL